MVYSTAERVSLIELYYENGRCANIAAQVFNEMNPDKHIQRKYIIELVAKFRETGSVANRKPIAPNRKIVGNEAVEVAVLGHVNMDPTLSTRKLPLECGISRTSIRRILKAHKFHPYKIHLVQQLNEDDFDRRLEFCEIMTERIINNPNLVFNTCFSDECSFFLNGTVNRHNCRYWSDENPHVFHEVHTQRPEKLNVWVGIYGDRLIGPFFLPGNLSGEMYLQLLEEAIDPALTETLENNNNYIAEELIFQQDGAPPHYTLAVRDYLNRTYPGRWIGRRGPTE